MGGKWSRKACCFSCRREGANLWDGHSGAGGDLSAKSQPQIYWVAGRGMVMSPQGTFALLWKPRPAELLGPLPPRPHSTPLTGHYRCR